MARFRLHLLLLLLPLLCYAPALRCGFVWDDHQVIERGRLIGDLRNAPLLFQHDTMYNTDGGKFAESATLDTYRPLTLLTFMVEHRLWGVRPAPYHLGSVLLHGGNTLLVFSLGQALALGPVAVYGALLFAVHPALSEAVYWINGRSDPLCVALFLTSLLLGMGWLRRGGWWRFLGATLACLGATLAKETAFMLALPLLWLLPSVTAPLGAQPSSADPSAGRAARRVRHWLALLRGGAPWLLGGALGLALRVLALKGLAIHGPSGRLGAALLRLPVLYWDGLSGLLLPHAELQPSLYETYGSVPLLRSALGCGAVLTLAVLAWRSRWPLLRFALATFLLTLAPICLLTQIEGWSGWGRYLYPSAPAVCLALAAVLSRLPVPRGGWYAVAVALLLLCGPQTALQGAVWRDDGTLARAQVVDHPEVSSGYSDAALWELQHGSAEKAVALIQNALVRAPTSSLHWSRAAQIYDRLGQAELALAAATQTVELAPRDPAVRLLHARLLLSGGQQTQAARALAAALALDPGGEAPRTLLRRSLEKLGQASAFAEELRRLGVPR